MAETSVKLLECVIAATGLLKIDQIGSGVGVILYSPAKKIGAGLHVLAPFSGRAGSQRPVMYANTAIPYALVELARRGVTPPYSVAIAGGAALLKSQNALGSSQHMIAAVKQALAKANLSVKIEETGGTKLRCMVLDIDAGKIKVG
jgi:chemotaxis receptor (MCP) glutamine deamidase CheD